MKIENTILKVEAEQLSMIDRIYRIDNKKIRRIFFVLKGVFSIKNRRKVQKENEQKKN